MSAALPLLGLLAVQSAIGLAMAARATVGGGRRPLAAAFCATIPGAGPLLAVVTLRLRGRGDSPALELTKKTKRAPQFRIAKDRMPVLDRLLADARERRAALAGISGAPSAAGVEAARWALERGEGETVVEAAMALEELTAGWEIQLAEARKALEGEPNMAQLLGVADLTANLLELDILDPSLAALMSEEACELYRRAADATPGRPPRIYLRWAKVELLAMRPEVAWELLDACDPPGDAGTAKALESLRENVRFAARRPLAP